jgi:hypothetical protein
MSDDLPVCELCGCRGNCECGHEPLNPEMGCTLIDEAVCPCCLKDPQHMLHFREARDRQEMLFEEVRG